MVVLAFTIASLIGSVSVSIPDSIFASIASELIFSSRLKVLLKLLVENSFLINLLNFDSLFSEWLYAASTDEIEEKYNQSLEKSIQNRHKLMNYLNDYSEMENIFTKLFS